MEILAKYREDTERTCRTMDSSRIARYAYSLAWSRNVSAAGMIVPKKVSYVGLRRRSCSVVVAVDV